MSLLVFTDHEGGRMAIPLELVTRRRSSPAPSSRTRGPSPSCSTARRSCTCVDISRLMLDRRRTSRTDGLSSVGESLPVIVYLHEGRRVGVVVGRILDVVQHDLVELQPGSRPGVAGTMVTQDRVTEVLDLPQILSDWDEDALAAITGVEELSA